MAGMELCCNGGAAEAALLRKEGHMVVSAHAEWPAPATRLGLRPLLPKKQSKKIRLEPRLPVIPGSVAGGSSISISRFSEDLRDWRRLPAGDIEEAFKRLSTSGRGRAGDQDAKAVARRHSARDLVKEQLRSDEVAQLQGLLRAVAVGTLQACVESRYWAPSADAPSAIECTMRSPISRVLAPADLSRLAPQDQDGASEPVVVEDQGALDLCHRLCAERSAPRVGLVHFVPTGDAASLDVEHLLSDVRESDLLLRTSFAFALQEMHRHLHADPVRVLSSTVGEVVATNDVNIVRAPLDLGASWLHAPQPSIDVLSVALLRHPRMDDQGQYARTADKALMVETLDRLFACAAALGIEALVIPPPGINGSSGCHHPPLDIGEILRKAALAYRQYIPRIYVCKSHASQSLPGWAGFASSVVKGRPPVDYGGLVPLPASPYIRPGWSIAAARRCAAAPSVEEGPDGSPCKKTSPRRP